MSKIALSPDAAGTGTFTLASPNGNTNRTITLPDGDVTLGAATPSITDNGNATAITIDANENVGIGTTGSPSQKLHVEGAGNQFILLNNSTTNDGFYFKAGAGASSIQTNAGSHVMNFFTSGSEAMRIDSSGAVTMPKQPAFLAQPASTQNNFPINAVTTLVMGTERFDQNADFASNTFTAPVTGKYLLNVDIYAQNLDVDTSYYQLDLTTSNRTYYAVKSLSGNDADVTYHNFVINVLADMDANDTAVVRFNIPNSGTAQMDVLGGSSFSGYLAC